MIATARHIRFSVPQYLRMSEAGVFDDRRVELLKGRVVEMHAQAHAHRWCVSKASAALQQRLAPEKCWVVIRGTLQLGATSAPEPDLHVFDVAEGTPDDRLPLPVLVIEVSDRTYRRDSGVKLRMYAEAGVQEYWIVNLKQRRIEVCRNPHNPTAAARGWTYRDIQHRAPGESITPLSLPADTIAVDEILP